MAYVPNPVDVTQPVDSVFASTAAAEFRALKAYIQTIVSGGGIGVATPGQIAMFAGNTALPGWLELDGSIQLRSSFAALWAAAQALGNVVTEANWAASDFGAFSSGDLATTFRLPDFRGMFIRGWNHGKAGGGYDTARVLGRSQLPTRIWDNGGVSGTGVLPFTGNAVGEFDESVNIAGAQFNAVAMAPQASTPAVYRSARPFNLSVMYCVKT